MSSVETAGLKALGQNSKVDLDLFNGPHPHLLEAFPSPYANADLNRVGAEGEVHIVAPEFTSLCPLTGQPDFATLHISYVPDLLCVESKSLKLYLMSFRNAGEFHESCVVGICNALVELLSPLHLQVRGEFTPRGGIPFWPVASYTKEDQETA